MSVQSQHHGNHHGHSAHHHAGHGHGPVVHAVAAGAEDAYNHAYEDAVPDPGCSVVEVELEAREMDWEFSPGRTTRAWGYNGRG